jgi:hypothetical protein
MRSLAERLRAFEQQKARLADAEAKLKIAEKKAYNRRLAEAGGLVAKAGLDRLSAETLFGALLSLNENAQDPKTVQQWTNAGSRALARESDAAVKDLDPIIVNLPGKANKDTEGALRKAGFRFNRILGHWEGLARLADASKLANEHGGEAHRASTVAQPESSSGVNGKAG